MLKKSIRITAGFLLLACGLIGWLLPIIPGWALVIPGLLILSREFRWARRLLAWLRSHFPRQAPAPAETAPPEEAVGKSAAFRDNEPSA